MIDSIATIVDSGYW